MEQLGTLQAFLLPRPFICQKLAVTKIHQPPFVLGSGDQLVLHFSFSVLLRELWTEPSRGPHAWVGGCSFLTFSCVFLALLRLMREVLLTFHDICSSLLLPHFPLTHLPEQERNRVGGLQAVFTALSKTGSFSRDWGDSPNLCPLRAEGKATQVCGLVTCPPLGPAGVW